MTLPKQVQEQIAEVEAMEQAMKEQAAASVVDVAADQPAEQTAAPEPAEAFTEQAEGSEAQKPPQPDKEEPRHDNEELTWQQRYKSLIGMYNAEVPTLHARNKELTRTVEELKASVEKLTARKDEPPKPSAVTDKDREAFGEDLIDLQRRVASEVVTPLQERIAELEAENSALRTQVTNTGTEVSLASFNQSLRTAVPDFDAVNADPRWVAWLDDVDPILRAPRRVVAQKAFDEGDVAGIAHFVTLWRSTVPAPAPQAKSPDTIQSQVAPSRSTAQTPQAQQARIYSVAEAEQLWDRVTQLGRQGKTDEANKLDEELSAAYAQGRVR